jgi:hypothetical protein
VIKTEQSQSEPPLVTLCAEMLEKISCRRQRDDPVKLGAGESLIMLCQGNGQGDFVEIVVGLANKGEQGIDAVAALFSIGR